MLQTFDVHLKKFQPPRPDQEDRVTLEHVRLTAFLKDSAPTTIVDMETDEEMPNSTAQGGSGSGYSNGGARSSFV